MDNRLVCINSRFILIWDDNIADVNREMIQNIDYYFFEEQNNYVKTLTKKDDVTEYERKIIINIFGHTAETFFGLLFACVQAPDFYYGWLSNYKNYELKEILEKTENNKEYFNKLRIEEISWESLAIQLIPEERKKDATDFARLWRMLYKEYMWSLKIYNSLKHGLRIKSDGVKEFVFDGMVFDNSQHQNGFAVYNSEKIDNDNYNVSLYRSFYHYNLEQLSRYIEIATISINNLKSFLLFYNNIESDEEILFFKPSKEWIEDFDKIKEPRIKGVGKFSTGCGYMTPLPTLEQLEEAARKQYDV